MTPQEAAAFLPLLKAYSEGRTIQWQDTLGAWHDITSLYLNGTADRCRIKPTPKLAPWTFETCPVGAVIVSKRGREKSVINCAKENSAFIGPAQGSTNYDSILESWTMCDGSPCGVEVVE